MPQGSNLPDDEPPRGLPACSLTSEAASPLDDRFTNLNKIPQRQMSLPKVEVEEAGSRKPKWADMEDPTEEAG